MKDRGSLCKGRVSVTYFPSETVSSPPRLRIVFGIGTSITLRVYLNVGKPGFGIIASVYASMLPTQMTPSLQRHTIADETTIENPADIVRVSRDDAMNQSRIPCQYARSKRS